MSTMRPMTWDELAKENTRLKKEVMRTAKGNSQKRTKWSYEKIEAELWAARSRYKKDKDFIPFIAGWIWSFINDNDYEGEG